MSEQTEQTRKWWASALLVGGVIGLLCLPLAALGTKVGLWSYALGIPMMGVGAVLATMIKLCLVTVMRAARNSRLSCRQNKLRFIQIGKINNAPHGGAGGLMVGLMKGISAGIGCFIRAAGTVGTDT